MFFSNVVSLRNRIEKQFGKISDELFIEILDVAQNDIYANIVQFGKEADTEYIYYISESYMKIIIRYNMV